MTGRERSSWCEWNTGFPGMSWTERCQGKGIDLNFSYFYISFNICSFYWGYCFLKYIFSINQGSRGYSGEKVSHFVVVFFIIGKSFQQNVYALITKHTVNILQGEFGEIGLDGINGEEVSVSV